MAGKISTIRPSQKLGVASPNGDAAPRVVRPCAVLPHRRVDAHRQRNHQADDQRHRPQLQGDVRWLLSVVSSEHLLQVLDDPPIGVFSRRSWAFWHLRLGREPISALPARRLSS